MTRRSHLLALPTGLVAALLAASASPVASSAATPPAFHAPSRADDAAISGATGHYASEPATIVGADGTRYVANQLGSQLSYTRDGGKTFTHVGGKRILAKNIDSSCQSTSDVGDVEMAADNAGRVFLADLQITRNSGANGADTGIQPIVGRSDDRFATYTGTCAGHQPASVDREWMAAYTAPAKTADSSDVYLSYHDFGPNFISVNSSHDGGRTWSQPVPVVDNANSVVASGCDTVPAGTAVDPRNGWVYVAWTSGDNPASNATTGCNYTQGTVFNKFWVAVSKDRGATFTTSLAYSGPNAVATEPNDMSEIFGSVATDRAGGVYIAFPAFLTGEYAAYYTYSPPADAAGHLSFAAPRRVSGSDVHTAYFTRLVAGDSGRVDLIYLGTPVQNAEVTPTTKTTNTGADPAKPNCSPEASDPSGHGTRFPGKPCELPSTTPWYLYLAQSLDATAPASSSWSTQKLRDDAVHTGDICTLGIFCLGNDNRDIADVNDVRIDATGGAQVAYTAENAAGTAQEIDFQCQSGGAGLYADVAVRDCQAAEAVPSESVPEVPLAALLPVLAAAMLAVAALRRRRTGGARA